jgi:hypothetical protein
VKKELRLSTQGLENVALLEIQDFALRMGDSSVGCSRFEASFLCPRITAALLSDPTITEYHLECYPEGLNVDADPGCLSGVLSLARNGSFELNSGNFECSTNCEELGKP